MFVQVLRRCACALAATVAVLAGTAAAAPGGCTVTNAQLDWGFKESFRSYISGSIANGQWTVADGASYETPSFGWSGGTGSFDGQSGTVSFVGSITFTGHGGALDTTVANPVIEFVDSESAVLLLDVSGTTQLGVPVDETGVPFAELDLANVTRDGDTLTVTDASATLTSTGAESFGTYVAGEPLDPVSITLQLDGECDAPADPSPAPWVVAGLALLALLGVLAFWWTRRRAAARAG